MHHAHTKQHKNIIKNNIGEHKNSTKCIQIVKFADWISIKTM